MTLYRKAVRQTGRAGLMLLLALCAAPRHAQARFDARDPLGLFHRQQMAAKLEVVPGDWGQARVQDIHTVLSSVAQVFLGRFTPERQALDIRVIPRAGSPRVLFERGPDGQYVIQLTARDENWFQFAYQFAHELCHVVSNYDHKAVIHEQYVQQNQWFEESLCEAAALFTLRQMAAAWAEHPPARNWAGYGATFAAYADHLLAEPHRHLSSGRSLRDWYAEHRAHLDDNPYQREQNELVATTLLPLFEAHPEYWQTISYLNPDTASASKAFPDYLADWHAAAPDKALPAAVMAYFGFSAASSPMASRAGLPGRDDGPQGAGER